MEKVSVLVVKATVALFIVSCSSTPPTAIEKPCTRTYQPLQGFSGQSFVIGDTPEIQSFNYRYNKAMWANYNQFAHKSQLSGHKATILCYERVPGPRNFQQDVVSLKVEGVAETIYADTLKVNLKMGDMIKQQKLAAEFQLEIGRKLWAKVDYPLATVNMNTVSGRTSLKNLEEVTVYKIDLDDHASSQKTPKNIAKIYFKTAKGLIVNKTYSTQLGVTEYTLDWHTSNPRTSGKDWPESIWTKIENGETELGMTSQMVSFAKGSPDNIETMDTRFGLSSTYFYNSDFVSDEVYYFENGVLVAVETF